MKGIVFTELLDFIKGSHGADLVDDVIEDSSLPHGGAYTVVGTYPFQEMQRIVAAFCRRADVRTDEVLREFGAHICNRFVARYPTFFAASHDLFDLLESVDRHIHVEVHKLYPDAELPRFTTASRGPGHLALDYQSCRPLEDLAEGMIQAAAGHYGERVTIGRERLVSDAQPFTRFRIERAA